MLNAVDADFVSIAHEAAGRGHVEVLEYLVTALGEASSMPALWWGLLLVPDNVGSWHRSALVAARQSSPRAPAHTRVWQSDALARMRGELGAGEGGCGVFCVLCDAPRDRSSVFARCKRLLTSTLLAAQCFKNT